LCWNFFVAYRYNGDAIQVIELLRESEVEKVGLIGGDHVQHSLRFQDLGLELGDLGIGEWFVEVNGLWNYGSDLEREDAYGLLKDLVVMVLWRKVK
jgi:hypothetical protein